MLDNIKIIVAETEADFTAAKVLFTAYQQWLGEDLCFQSFDAELLQLQTMYGPPQGKLLLAKSNEAYVGCVAVRNKGKGICEMKRLYVIDACKGQGLGRRLALEIINTAAQLGYHKMILDTLTRLTPALHLYNSLGFTETTAYYPNPLQGVVYMELVIG
jgi:ribosomal protein S18 acetylase RimI-like enzyme